MAIRFTRPGEQTDILHSKADVLVNAVNTVGVMGKGVAKAIADRYPAVLPPYRDACRSGALKPGVILETRLDRQTGVMSATGDLTILHFPTKVDWRNPSRLEWIEQGLAALSDWIADREPRSIALPPLGCGNGGLSWNAVAPMIVRHLSPFAETVDIQLLGPDPALEKVAFALNSSAPAIAEFQGENRIYSNMYPAPVMWGDEITPPRLWPCNEVAYVAAKTADPAMRQKVLDVYHGKYQNDPKNPWPAGPGGVKKFGRTIALRPDWDEIKISVMEALVADKFTRNSELRQRLLATGDRLIQEGNRWADTFWGVSLKDIPQKGIKAGDGRNELGKILMRVRGKLRSMERQIGDTRSASDTQEKPRLRPVVAVVNLKAIRKSPRDPLPADVLDCSRYGTAAFRDGTKLGNPFVMTEYGGRDGSREDVIRKHAEKFAADLRKPGFAAWLTEVTSGKRLGCFCSPAACHCDTIMAAANAIIAGRDPQEAIKPYLTFGLASAKAQADTSEVFEYAGIGSRETPEGVLVRIREVAQKLARDGWKLRSGGADGADINFEMGCDAVGGAKIIFLPWPSFEAKSEVEKTGYRPVRRHDQVSTSVSPAALELAKKFHPRWQALSQPAQKLMARNGYQVLERDLSKPADVILCWTQDGQLKGGTSQALRIAAAHQIPVINLGASQWREATPDQIVAAALEKARAARAMRSKCVVERQGTESEPSPRQQRAKASPVAPIKNSLLMR